MKYALDLQKALYDGIVALGYEVRDSFPSDVYPLFVVIGDDYGSKENVKNLYSAEIISNIRVYSKYKGTKEIKETMTDIIEMSEDLEVTGFDIYTFDVMYSSILPYISEREYREGLLQLRFKLI